MECGMDDAKQEARECGERWSDIKDEWIDQWIADNWDDAREAEFDTDFRMQWKADHGTDFPEYEATPPAPLPARSGETVSAERAA
jgi:hypothetical protein